MGIVRLDGCAEYRWPLLFCPGSSFRSRISLGDGTGNGPMISLRPSLITAHHSVSSLSDPAREASPCSRYLRPARDVDTTCTVRRNVHESMATKVRAHRAPNLLRGCVGRSHRSTQRRGRRPRPLEEPAPSGDRPGRARCEAGGPRPAGHGLAWNAQSPEKSSNIPVHPPLCLGFRPSGFRRLVPVFAGC